ncbi:flippase [Candidatus Wolfebacteria bacterium]|nr:flippase [Candidatus Wolfebacteria bacterium]
MLSKIKGLIFENKTAKQTVVKNMFWLSFSQVGSRLIKAAITIYAARVLGASGYGTLSYVLGLTGFFTIFADIGVNSILTREIAKNSKDEDRYFSTVAVIKLALLFFAAALIVFISPYFSKIEEVKILIPFVALLIIFDGLRDLNMAFFRGKEKMELEAFVVTVTNVLITLFGFTTLYFWTTYKALLAAYIAASFCGFLIATYFLREKWLKIRKDFTKQLVVPIARSAWPMAVGGIVGSFLFNVDIIMLGWWRTSSEIGLYSAAQRIVGLFYNIPSLLAIAVFPMFSRFIYANNEEKVRSLTTRTITILFMAAIPIVIGGILFKNQIINFVYGMNYAGAADTFSVLIVSIFAIFPFAILNDLVFAYDKQKKMLIYGVIAALSNIVLNFFLIPLYGIMGAAIATTFANILNVAMLWKFVKKINKFKVLPQLFKIIISVAIMSISVFILKELNVHLIANILLSAVIYFVSLYMFKDRIFMEILSIFGKGYKKFTNKHEGSAEI